MKATVVIGLLLVAAIVIDLIILGQHELGECDPGRGEVLKKEAAPGPP